MLLVRLVRVDSHVAGIGSHVSQLRLIRVTVYIVRGLGFLI